MLQQISPISVHGKYSDWGSFSECSEPCGTGTKTRTRTCDNPLPANGGDDCTGQGSNSEEVNCNEHLCPSNTLEVFKTL